MFITRKEFGGEMMSQQLIETMGPTFRESDGVSRILFHRDGRIYTNEGKITRGDIDTEDPYALTRTFLGESMQTLMYFAHCKGEDALTERRLQQTNEKVFMLEEIDPRTYRLFPCDPTTRSVQNHDEPLTSMLLEEFIQLPSYKQRCHRVLYSNHVDTLRLVPPAGDEDTLQA